MDTRSSLLETLEKNNFKVSTDTRKDISDSVYFALRGETFDGNLFINDALEGGAVACVTDNPKNAGDNIYVVENVLETLQDIALIYRKTFDIPIIAIGGSNGKTTSKELLRSVLQTKYKVHSTQGSFNNHIGVPLSVLSMDKETEVGVFEIGANHNDEHTKLLEILYPTHAVVTNNGMDHLEGFGSMENSRKANKEIYDWAISNENIVFVNKKHDDLLEDSQNNKRILYSNYDLESINGTPLIISLNEKEYKTQLIGDYNLENIDLAIAIGEHFDIDIDTSISAVCEYIPLLKRSQFLTKNNINFIVDCYNANPTSMKLSLDSFANSDRKSKGIIIGDMFELGSYSEDEHKKIVEHISQQNFDCVVFVGNRFKKALESINITHKWFPDSDSARTWFITQKFDGYIFLLKGSRGITIEKLLEF